MACAFATLLPSAPTPISLSLCDLAKDYGSYRDKLVSVRGYCGLRQACPQSCANKPWPSFVELRGGGSPTVWDAVAEVERSVEAEAKKGKRFEIWVTVIGRLDTRARPSRRGPCDNRDLFGYGHLGVFPAELVVESFTDIKVIENPASPYDYANMYHGAL